MKSPLYWNHTHPLERSFYPSQPKKRSVNTKLHDLWQMAIAQLSLSSEPRVWQTQDHLGRTVWSGYDPATGQSVRQITAQEMQVWLEERYY